MGWADRDRALGEDDLLLDVPLDLRQEDEHLRASRGVRDLARIFDDATSEVVDHWPEWREQIAQLGPAPGAVEHPADLVETVDDEVLDRLVVRRPAPHRDGTQEKPEAVLLSVVANARLVERLARDRERGLDRGVAMALRRAAEPLRRLHGGARRARRFLDVAERREGPAARGRQVPRRPIGMAGDRAEQLERDVGGWDPCVAGLRSEDRVLDCVEVRVLLAERDPCGERPRPSTCGAVGQVRREVGGGRAVEEREMMEKCGLRIADDEVVDERGHRRDVTAKRGSLDDLGRAPMRPTSKLGHEPARTAMNRGLLSGVEREETLDDHLVLEPLQERFVVLTPRHVLIVGIFACAPSSGSIGGLFLVLVQAPYRIAATPEPEAPDPADAYEALLRERARRFRPLVVGGLGLAVAITTTAALGGRSPAPRGPTFDEQAAHEVERARIVLEDARAEAMNEQLRFADAFAASRTKPPQMRATRCSVPTREAPMLVVRADERELLSPSVARVMRDVVRAEELLANGRSVEGVLYATALGPSSAMPLGARLHQDVVVLADVLKAPTRTTPSSFEPGSISGRVLVYDFAEHRVTCVGEVTVESSRLIAYAYIPGAMIGPVALNQGPSLSASLDVDLNRKLETAIASGPLFQLQR